jgi:predicted metalloprotease with PDZ domain
MAVWTPYVIREYAKNLEAVTARTSDGRPLVIEKSRKNRWRIQTTGADPVMVSYRVYCHVMGVQDNWVDDEFALINGAATFLTLGDLGERPHDVQVILPPAWKTTATGMPPVPDAPNHYRAPDYETLVDSPIVAGNPAVHQFNVEGKEHYLVDVGEDGVFDGERAAQDLARIVREDAKCGAACLMTNIFSSICSPAEAEAWSTVIPPLSCPTAGIPAHIATICVG